jgi:hypothetical protein
MTAAVMPHLVLDAVIRTMGRRCARVPTSDMQRVPGKTPLDARYAMSSRKCTSDAAAGYVECFVSACPFELDHGEECVPDGHPPWSAWPAPNSAWCAFRPSKLRRCRAVRFGGE